MKKLILLFYLMGNVALVQSLQRHTISPIGSYKNINGVVYRETIGQPFNTNSKTSNSEIFRPGFQHPLFYINKLTESSLISIIPNPASCQLNLKSKISLLNTTISIFNGVFKLSN